MFQKLGLIFLILLTIQSNSRNLGEVDSQIVKKKKNKNKGELKKISPEDSQEPLNIHSFISHLFEPLFANLEEDDLITNSDFLEVDQKYKINKKQISFIPKILPSGKQLFVMELSGKGTIAITVFKKKSQILDSHVVFIESLVKPCKFYFDPSKYFISKDHSMKLNYIEDENPFYDLKAKISVVEDMKINFNENEKIYSNFMQKFQFKVFLPKEIDSKKDNRLQFIVQTTVDYFNVNGQERLEMYINKQQKFADNKNYDMTTSGTLGLGLIKTIPKNSQLFCGDSSCDPYYVTIYAEHIEFFYFFPTILENGATMSFNTYLLLIEELEIKEILTYKLMVPLNNGNWVFTVMPTQGNTNFYINPDFKPEKLGEYKYQGLAHRTEEIIITKYEADLFKFNFTTFYVTFQSADPDQISAFKFEINRLISNQRKMIIENYAENGVVAVNEIINFYIDFRSTFDETVHFTISLESSHGSADLFIRECSLNTTQCDITDKDIKQIPNFNATDIELKEWEQKQTTIFKYFRTNNTDLIPIKKIQLPISFNCLASKQFAESESKDKTLPDSNSCIFAIAVFGQNSDNQYGSIYKLETKGQNVHKEIDLKENYSINVNEKERLYYRLDISKKNLTDIKKILLTIFSISGKFSVYYSTANIYPSRESNEGYLDISQQSFSIHSKKNVKEINISAITKEIYITIEAEEYSTLDLYIDFQSNNQIGQQTETIQIGKILKRQIEENSVQKVELMDLYYKNFYFKLDDTDMSKSGLNFVLNTNKIGLEICIQLKPVFEFDLPCDYESTSDILTFAPFDYALTPQNEFSISIRKRHINLTLPRFPIEFSFTIQGGIEQKNSENLIEGHTFTSMITPLNLYSFQFSLEKMKKNALIMLYSDNPQVKGYIMKKDDKGVVTALLSRDIFAVELLGNSFKKKYCQIPGTCQFLINVYSNSSENARFSITYSIDYSPIVLKEGVQIQLPGIQQYFIYEPEIGDPLTFRLSSDRTQFVVYLSELSQKQIKNQKILTKSLNEEKFAFKSKIDKSINLLCPEKAFEQGENTLAGILMIPKFNMPYISQDDAIRSYNLTDIVRASVHSKLKKLEQFEQTEGEVSKGDFTYFYFHLDQPRNFTLTVSVSTGKCLLYLNQGTQNLTSQDSYWKRTKSYDGGQIFVNFDEFKIPKDMVGSYVLGVYGQESSSFTLLFLPSIENVISIKFQRLLEFELEKGKKYFVNYFNKKQFYETFLYAENADVHVEAMEYTMNSYLNVMDKILDNKSYDQKFELKNGAVPRKNDLSNMKSGDQIIVKFEAQTSDAKITFAIYDKNQPILGFVGKRFQFIVDKNEEQIFKIQLGDSFDEADIDVRLSFGELDIYISEFQDKFENTNHIKGNQQKYIKYVDEKKQKVNDILIFKDIYIKVKGYELSKFSLFVKPKGKFKEIKANEAELIYLDSENDQYIYFEISSNKLESIKKLTFNLDYISFFGTKPELLFIADEEVVLSNDSPFLPMPLIDTSSTTYDEFLHQFIRPEVSAGFYIIKFSKSVIKIPIKISASINDKQTIEPNGIYYYSIQSSAQFTLFIPNAGEFRLLLESCQDFKISSAIFDHFNNSTQINFESGLAQPYLYLNIDESHSEVKRQIKTIDFPVKRGIVSSSGVLNFNITSPEFNNKMRNFVLFTEFRPENKQLILKDYVELYMNEESFSKLLYTYEFSNGLLTIKSKLPHFKQQLMVDYPNIKKILIRIKFFLFSDPNFAEKLQKCGLSAIDTIQNTPRAADAELLKDQINQELTDYPINLYFLNEDIKKLGDVSYLNVFAYMHITFFENEAEAFNISLDLKFTSVPYFLLTIKNEIRFKFLNQTGSYIWIIAGFLFLIILYVLYKKNKKQKVEKRNDADYSREGDRIIFADRDKLEMSNISRDSDNQIN